MRIVAMGSAEGLGGLQTHFRLLLNFLVREGHEVGAISVADSGNIHTGGLVFSVNIPHSSKNVFQKLAKSWSFYSAHRLASKFKPDLFIGAALGNAYAAMARSLPPTTFKFYQEICCDIVPNDPLRILMSTSYDAIAAQSQSIDANYRSSISTTKPIKTLPCFAESLNCEQLAVLPVQGEPLRLCYFGRLAANKGLAQFLKAFAEFRQTVAATLDIHGQGAERQNLENIVKSLELSDAVRFCGPYPAGDDYARMLSTYHALVLPSVDTEGLPLVLLESMQCGLPFLATKVGAIADAAIDNPDVMVVSPDTASIVQGLRLLTEKLYGGQISPSRLQQYYVRMFSTQVLEQNWIQMLNDARAYF